MNNTFLDKEGLKKLNFFEISHEELPDVVPTQRGKIGSTSLKLFIAQEQLAR